MFCQRYVKQLKCHQIPIKLTVQSFLSLVTGEEEKIQKEIFIHYSPRWGKFKHNRWVMNDSYKLYRDGRFFNTVNDTLEQSPLVQITPNEQKLKQRFQKILDEKENEVPFNLNNMEFKIKQK